MVQGLDYELWSVAKEMVVWSVTEDVQVTGLDQFRVAINYVVGSLLIGVIVLLDVAGRQELLSVFRSLTVAANGLSPIVIVEMIHCYVFSVSPLRLENAKEFITNGWFNHGCCAHHAVDLALKNEM